MTLSTARRPAHNQSCIANPARKRGLHMKKILVIGAGKIGSTIAALLGSAGDYAVTLADA